MQHRAHVNKNWRNNKKEHNSKRRAKNKCAKMKDHTKYLPGSHEVLTSPGRGRMGFKVSTGKNEDLAAKLRDLIAQYDHAQQERWSHQESWQRAREFYTRLIRKKRADDFHSRLQIDADHAASKVRTLLHPNKREKDLLKEITSIEGRLAVGFSTRSPSSFGA